MIIIYTTIIAVVLLAILLYTLPLHLSWKGRTAILLCSVCLALVPLFSKEIFPIWILYSMQLLLAILLTYMMMNRLQFSNKNETEETIIPKVHPLFSFPELQERAKASETIDEYYVSSFAHDSTEPVQYLEPDPLIISKEEEIEVASSLDRTEDTMDQRMAFEEDSSEFIDFNKREIIEDSHEFESFGSSDEDEMLEARKKLFENLEDPVKTTMDEMAISLEKQQPHPKKVNLPPEERLSHAFDDLEEIYLRKKKEGEK